MISIIIKFKPCLKGQKFYGDLLTTGKILWENTQFASPSSWATYIKKRLNPSKKSGSGWNSVKYKVGVLFTQQFIKLINAFCSNVNAFSSKRKKFTLAKFGDNTIIKRAS